MSSYKYEPKILTDIVNSDEIKLFAKDLKNNKNDLLNIANSIHENIIAIADKAAKSYKQRCEEYNGEVSQRDRIFIFPSVRQKMGSDRKYSTFRWLQYINSSYDSRVSNKSWTVREVKKTGKNYSATDFKRTFTNKNNPFIQSVLEMEHIFRFCRQQYQTVNAIHKILNSNTLSEYNLSDLLLDGFVATFYQDPLCVSRGLSLFNDFYERPTTETEDAPEGLSESQQDTLDEIFSDSEKVYF